ncbi:MAG: PAS domain S-box protein [Thermoleophilia bacterium]
MEVDRMLAGLIGREQAEVSIRKREERLGNINNQSPIAIEYYDADGLLLDVNQACLDMFGVDSASEVTGFNLFEDANLTEDARIKLRAGEPVQYESVFDFDLVREKSLYRTSKQGRIFVHIHLTPLKTEAGSIYGHLLHGQDITGHKREENIREARLRLIELSETHTLEQLLQATWL